MTLPTIFSDPWLPPLPGKHITRYPVGPLSHLTSMFSQIPSFQFPFSIQFYRRWQFPTKIPCLFCFYCKTQNSGLRSKEEIPPDPINQTSRCNSLQSNPIGTNFTGFCLNLKQFYWYKRRGLLFKLRRPLAFQLSLGLLLGVYWLAGSRSPNGGGESHHFMGNRNPSPGCLPAPAPAAPHNKIYFSASKTNKKNIRHMNYRHW